MNTNPLVGPIALGRSSWNFYKAHWKALTALIIIPMAAIFIGNLLSEIGASMHDLTPTPGAALEIIGFLIFLAAGVFMIAAIMGLIHSVHKLNSEAGFAIHIWSEYKVGFTYFWPLVLIGIMRGIALLGASAVFVIPGIILAVYTIFVAFSLVADGKHGMAAFIDSFTLVHGRWWKVLGRLFYLIVSYMIAVLIVAGIFFLARTIFHYAIGSVADSIVTGVLMTALALAFIPYAITYLYGLFAALKAGRLDSAHARTKLYKDLFIAFMVIGVLLFAGAIVAGRVLGPGHGPQRLPGDTNLATSASASSSVTAPERPSHSNGNLVV